MLAVVASALLASIPIQLDGQLWARPLGEEGKLKFRILTDATPIRATLEPGDRLGTYRTRIAAREIESTLTFLLIPASEKAPSHVVTQVRLYNAATKTLIAECANYDSTQAEQAPGVGVCSGVIGGTQFGLTLSRAARRTF